jgi:hypothetical protein
VLATDITHLFILIVIKLVNFKVVCEKDQISLTLIVFLQVSSTFETSTYLEIILQNFTKFTLSCKKSVANSTTAIYNASAVKIYNAMRSVVHFLLL